MAARKGKVQLYDAASDEVIVADAAEVPELLEQGLEIETEDAAAQRQYEKTAGAGEALKSVGENLASGATFGLSDVALAATLGDEYREGRKRRDETFEGLAGASQVVGGVAPVLLSGGSGLVSRAAALSPANLAARAGVAAERTVGRIGGKALEGSVVREALGGAAKFGAAGMVEGALAGGGFALSEEALEGELGSFDAVAERVWAGAKKGAMFGLAGGAALGGVAGAAKGSLRKIGERFQESGDELAEAANERAFKVMSPRYTDARKLGVGKIQQIGEDIRNYQLRDGTNLLEALDNTESFAPKMARARAEVTEELGALRAKVAADPTPVNAGEFLRRIDNEVLDPLRNSPSPTIRRQGERAMAELEQLRARGDAVTYADMLEQQRALKAVIYPKVPKGGVSIAPEGAEHLQRIERILEETMEGHVERVLSRGSPLEQVSAMGLTNANYLRDGMRDMGPLRRAHAAGKQFDPVRVTIEPDGLVVLQDGRHRMALAQETGATAIQARVQVRNASGDVVSETVGPVSLQPKMPDVGDAIGKYKDARRLAESFIKADDLLRKTNPQNKGNRFLSLTDYMSGLGSAGTVVGAMVGGAPGAVVGAGVNLAASYLHKQARERGSAMLATLYTRSRNVDKTLNQQFGSFFRDARDAVKRATLATGGAATGQAVAYDVRRVLRAQRDETPEQAYDRVVARAQDISSGRAIGPYVLDDHAPRTGQKMRELQLRAANHLVKHAPVPPKRTTNPNLGALTAQQRPDPMQLYEFSRRMNAIEDPMSILADLNGGSLSVAAVEAVRDVYPQLYAEMQARVIDGLAASKELLPYEHRIRLGVLFDIPTDPTLRPEYIQAIQASYVLPEKPPQAPAPPGGASARSKRLSSLAQELEVTAEL